MLSGFKASNIVGRHPCMFYPLTGLFFIFLFATILYLPTLGRLTDLFKKESKYNSLGLFSLDSYLLLFLLIYLGFSSEFKVYLPTPGILECALMIY